MLQCKFVSVVVCFDFRHILAEVMFEVAFYGRRME